LLPVDSAKHYVIDAAGALLSCSSRHDDHPCFILQ